ncbi:MAG: SDR family NAD(P)-dependent oxidoreductase [Acidimicrobiales bacterium]|nr:SDR family NAD(P)-dependent oxidoreductase [Acidimicrobiales bacterium]
MRSATDLSGRSIVITGANSGIGLEATRELARRGASVTLACRSSERAAAAIARLRSDIPDAELRSVTCDLASLSSVRSAADELLATHPRIDVLVNNAGIMAVPAARSVDGFEVHLATNHFGHFALTGLLLPRLLEQPGARIVSVASLMYRFARLDFHDLHSTDDGRWRAYATSKLANLLFIHELQRRLSAASADAIAVACHPGFAATELQNPAMAKVPGAVRRIADRAVRLSAQSPADGAAPVVYAAVHPGLHGGEFVGPGGAFGLRGDPEVASLPAAATDIHDSIELWKQSVELTGLDPAQAIGNP